MLHLTENFQPRYDGSMDEINDANMWELVGIGPFANLNNKYYVARPKGNVNSHLYVW
jgi:hypothetical protein